MTNINYFIEQKIHQYHQEINQWVHIVENASNIITMFRHASHRPKPNGIVSSMSYMTRLNVSRAQKRVERALETQLYKKTNFTTSDVKCVIPNRICHIPTETLQTLQRFTRGHYPRVYQEIERIITMHRSAEQ